MKKDWSQYAICAFLPLLAVGSIYITEFLSRRSFFTCQSGYCNESIPANIGKVFQIDPAVDDPDSTGLTVGTETDLDEALQERKITALRYSGRMSWFFLAGIYLLICCAALVVAAILMIQLFPQQPIQATLAVIGLSAVVGLFFFFNPSIHMNVFLVLFSNKAITPDVPAISFYTNVLDSLGNAALSSLLLSIWATLWLSKGTSLPEGIKPLSQKMKYLRLILYLGTLLLVVTMLLKKSIYQWSLAYTTQEIQSADFARDFIASLLSLDGGFYTLVLAAAYFPAALVLQKRARLATDLPIEEPEKEKRLKEYGMIFTLSESMPKIISILGPVLVGPVGELLKGSLF